MQILAVQLVTTDAQNFIYLEAEADVADLQLQTAQEHRAQVRQEGPARARISVLWNCTTKAP